MTRIGLITIGQSPRDDVISEIRPLLPPATRIVQAGALDGLSLPEIHAQRPSARAAGLVTLLTSGQEVLVQKAFVQERVQKAVSTLQEQVQLIGLLCSAPFPGFSSRVHVLVPHRFITAFISALSLPGPLGVLVPSRQEPASSEEPYNWGVPCITEAVSPYTEGESLREAASALADKGVCAILMDCFGYSLRMKREVQKVVPQPVILARSLFAHVLSELL